FGPERAHLPMRLAARPVAAALRAWDVATAPRVHHFAANSRYVAARIQRYYGRDSEVIPPPADTAFYTPNGEAAAGYDLVVSALVPYKRVELVLEAYRGTGRVLKVVGTGPQADRLRALAPPEATFLGGVSDLELRDLYRGCRAVIMPSVEDFGIVPVEAMACGRPAVVFAEGGGPESVIEGETGLVFREATPEALRAVVDSLGTVRFNSAALRARAESFSRDTFEARFRAFVERALRTAAPQWAPPW
ncbi:MAG: glycosyltransferase, partial [bacterium]